MTLSNVAKGAATSWRVALRHVGFLTVLVFAFAASAFATACMTDITPPANPADSLRFTSMSMLLSTCALDRSGGAWCWGGNSIGVIGDGTTADRLVPTAVLPPPGAGTRRYSALSTGLVTCGLAAQRAYCWGENRGGMVGDGTIVPRLIPTAVVGPNGGPPLAFSAISAGGSSVCGIAGGAAYCWGYNTSGQLGIGVRSDFSSTPVLVLPPSSGDVKYTSIAVGSGHACALDTTARAWCWGERGQGQLGDGPADGVRLPTRNLPTAVQGPAGGPPLPFNFIVAGSGGTCGISNTSLYCWGDKSEGRLAGTPSSTSYNTGLCTSCESYPLLLRGPESATSSFTGVTQVAIGSNHVCAISLGALYCWGVNHYGELGAGAISADFAPRRVLVPGSAAKPWTAVAAGVSNSCGIAGETTYCWGQNLTGAVGDGSTTPRLAPVRVHGTPP